MMVFEWMDEWINISESMRCRRLTMLRGFSIIMKDRKIEDRVKSKGLYGKDRSHSLANVGPKY
ncbi:hypothetical protein HanPI659440_Chr01g0000881 [Helianthus annuus]|uniref:Uncharacterized protein n=1 Tax=Helianthus annuus TaxID=4232 RepID=A0A251SKP5_HELAN|nr:hypothetical protein HanIR_Chr14g0718181 [Helianthus annuus]KAJ0512988.1 hypothetical protein HanHA300_Chr10g0352351 [Helianthus annuus]KAJ0529109.1 hypothetical protein HanHA89_Chr10g0374011 [Helianthus annuus]KAJ0568401.1 hypothetical protein HanIR_Chr06g0295851 [Helianthus annuus]KAJ0589223.1 hypothetical protein HanIR_Chr04g0183671 [Helianthus annuus]